MLAVVEVGAGQAAKRGKAADEEGPRTPPQPLKAARPPRQPTPDHPPYCWMIGEAIDLLAEDGGSSEDDISACIGARHPGVPPAHERLLRHYLGKHVAEGIFVRTAAGLYQRRTEENAAEVMLLQVEQQAEAGLCKPASVEAKRERGRGRGRGRGRPHRVGSPSTPPKGRKDGGAGVQWMTPSAGSSLTPATAAKDSVPVSLVAVADKDGSQAPSLKPKSCRRRLRKLGMASSGDSALVAGKKHGSEVPYTLDKEHEPPRKLGLVIFGDSPATSAMDKACTEVPPTMPPVDGGQALHLALVTTTEVPMPEPAPTPAMDKDGGDASSIVDKNDSICTTSTVPEPGSQACKLALMAAEVPPSKPLVDGAQPLDLALVSTTKVPVPEPAPTPTPTPPTPTPGMDKDGDQPLDLAQVTTTEVSEPAPPMPAMDKDGSQPLHLSLVATTEVSEPAPPTPAMDKDGGQPLDLALLNTAEVRVSEPAPTPTPAMNKDGGMDKNESICTTATVPEPGSQACKLALKAAAAAAFVPVLVANTKGGLKGSPSATYKDALQPRKACSAPTPGKKAGGKALSVSALLEGRRRQHKSAAVATGDRSALTPGKKLVCKLSFASPKLTPVTAGGCPTPASVADQGGIEASAALKQHGQPRKLYPVSADEISDDPGTVLLALPSQTLAASNTQLQNLGTTRTSYAKHFQNC